MFERKVISRALWHVLFWLAYIVYELVNTGWSNRDTFSFRETHELWLDLPMMVTIVYLNMYWLMPEFLYPKKYLQYAIGLFCVLVLGGLYSRYIGYRIWLPWDRIHEPAAYLVEPKNFFIPVRIVRNTLHFVPVLALTVLIKILSNSSERERALRRTEVARHHAELSYLKAQIHPHFFFNTLNTIYALTQRGSEKSSEIVLRLSGIMHYMLYESNSDVVLLESEVAHLKDYIGIERLRFADRLDLSFTLTGNTTGKMIAPLLLLPFVENAFKHSLVNETGKATINLDIKVTDNELLFQVLNSYKKTLSIKKYPGMGLENVKKRLELTYPGEHQLEISDSGNTFSIVLKLALHEKN